MENSKFTDALGNPIIIGKKYGYARTSNGHITVAYGIATKLSDKGKLRLTNVTERSGIYGELNKKTVPGTGRSVYAAVCFPVVPKEAIMLLMMNDE